MRGTVGRKVKEGVIMVAVVVMLAPLSSISWAEKPPAKAQPKEKAAVTKDTSQKEEAAVIKSKTGDVALAVVTSAGKPSNIDLENKVPVRGMQFTVKGMQLTEVRTTSRTKGFLVKFNEKSGIVVLVSLTTDEIAPGKGAIAELIGEHSKGASISLSDVNIVGRDRAQLYP